MYENADFYCVNVFAALCDDIRLIESDVCAGLNSPLVGAMESADEKPLLFLCEGIFLEIKYLFGEIYFLDF